MKHAPSQTRHTRMLAWAVASLAVGLVAYLVAVETPRPVYHQLGDRSLLYVHIIGAATAIVLGPFLFLRMSRRPSTMAFHRWFGRCYVISIALASSTSLAIARLYEPGGVVSQLGIATAAATWGTTTMIAWWYVRHRQIHNHREWMVRSYAVTLAFLTHRLWVTAATGLLVAVGGSGHYGAPLGDWLFWITNLLLGEVAIRVMRQRRVHRAATV